MALFDNVTYTYYTGTLGRTKVPSEDVFNVYKLQNVLYVKSLLNDGLLKEREAGGIDNACCMMIEEDYCAAQAQAGADDVHTSESIGGYSYTASSKASELAIEKNAKRTAEKKYEWLSLYCDILNGVR